MPTVLRTLTPFIPNHLYGCSIRRAAVCHDDMWITVSLHCFLEEFQRSSLVPLFRDTGFQNFAFIVDGAPQVMLLASDVGYACLRLTKTSSRCHCHGGLRRMASDRRFGI